MKTTLQILTEARALIEKPENWAQRGDAIMQRGLCALFAIETAEGGRPYHSPKSKTCLAFCEASGAVPGNIGGWNDAPDRTHAEVVAAFDKAIAAERDRAEPALS